jgi:hypothetical protein
VGCSAPGTGLEAGVDGVADLPFQRAQGFFAGLAFGQFLLVAGAALAVPVADLGDCGQAWFQEQLDALTAERQLQLIARNARRLNDRAAHLLELVRATAARDSQIATLWHDINNERLSRARTSAQRLAAKAELRTSVPDAAHTLWALTVPELYVLHVTESGRRPDTYQHWLADVLIAVLLAH